MSIRLAVFVVLFSVAQLSSGNIDFALTTFEVTDPSDVEYSSGNDVLIDAKVRVRNEGTNDVSSDQANHFTLKLYFSDDIELNNGTLKSPDTGISVDVGECGLDNMKRDYPGSTSSPSSPARPISFSATVALPSNNCTKYSHLCIDLVIPVATGDTDTSNNFQCLAMVAQPPLGAGFRNCRPSSSTLVSPSLYNVMIIGLLLPVLLMVV